MYHFKTCLFLFGAPQRSNLKVEGKAVSVFLSFQGEKKTTGNRLETRDVALLVERQKKTKEPENRRKSPQKGNLTLLTPSCL